MSEAAESKIQQQRSKRAEAEPEADRNKIRRIQALVEMVIFTDHLLLAYFCEKYSSNEADCAEGKEQLEFYVRVVFKGVSL